MKKNIRTNEDRLVRIAVQGKIANAVQYGDFELSHEGRPYSCPSTGSIVYNIKAGDNVFCWAGDHIEPGVSAILDETKRESRANMGFNFLACAGNTVRVVSGDAKGAKGTVLGHHGGVEHVLLDFDDATLGKLTLDDKFLIEACGQGLELLDYQGIKVYSLDPSVLHKLPLRPRPGGMLEIGVTHVVPACLIGSGLGHNNIGTGDCDIMTHDPETVRSLKLDELCFGDLVAIQDHDHSYGRTFRKGAVTVGIIIHSNSLLAGHGPGLSTILTSAQGMLRPVINPRANLARILGIGRYRPGSKIRKK